MKIRLPEIGLLLAIILVIFARIHLISVRQFDPDEFAHMHWAWLATHGYLPYRDFFFYVAPVYQWFLAPVFLLLPAGPLTAIAARYWEFGLYLFSAYLLYRIARTVTGGTVTPILAVFIFLTFPMTVDKTIDVRPDMLMVALYLASVFLILKSGSWTAGRTFLTGAAAGAAVITLPKILFALPAAGYLLFAGPKKFPIRFLPYLLLGGIFPGLVFAGYLAAIGQFTQAVTAITTDSFIVNAGKIPFSPWKALSPWPLVYMDAGGPSIPWYVNSALWILAVFGFILIFVKKPRYGLFFILFYVAGILFLFSFPAPYLQYFLPLSVFASLIAAYAATEIAGARILKNLEFLRPLPVAFLVGALAISFYVQYALRVQPSYVNSEQLGVLRDIVTVSKPGDRVYDMVGSYVFRPDGYYFCCHPYAEFIDNLKRPYPTLSASLINTRTKYLILDRTGQSLWKPKPADLTFLETHFIPSPYKKIYFPGATFSCENGICTRLNVHGRATPDVSGTFDIFVADTYRVEVTPPESTVRIDGSTKAQGADIHLDKGVHTLTAPPFVTSVRIIYKP